MWRDQIKHICIISTKTNQKITRKRKVQNAIQLPFLTNEGINYLLKMKDDTYDFNQLFSNQFINFSDKNCDPFLIQASMLPKKSIA